MLRRFFQQSRDLASFYKKNSSVWGGDLVCLHADTRYCSSETCNLSEFASSIRTPESERISHSSLFASMLGTHTWSICNIPSKPKRSTR